MDNSQLTPEIRDQLSTLMQALEVPQLRDMVPPEMQQVYESLAAPLGEFQEVVMRIDAESGASELKGAIAAATMAVGIAAANAITWLTRISSMVIGARSLFSTAVPARVSGLCH